MDGELQGRFFEMKRNGYRVAALSSILPAKFVRSLRDEFSITTAEEFVWAVSQAGEQIRKHLKMDKKQWDKIVREVRSALPRSVLTRMQRPSTTRFSKGAILEKPPKSLQSITRLVQEE